MVKIESLSNSKNKLECFNNLKVASLRDSRNNNNHLECKHITNNSSSVLRIEVDKRKGIIIPVISMNS